MSRSLVTIVKTGDWEKDMQRLLWALKELKAKYEAQRWPTLYVHEEIQDVESALMGFYADACPEGLWKEETYDDES